MGLFDFLTGKTAATPAFNPSEPMAFYDPTEEERKRARKMALIQAGAGMLMNNRDNYGEFAPALGAGIAQGLQGYQQGLQEGPERRMKQLQQQLYAQQVGAQVNKAKADSVDDDVAMGVFRNVFQEAGYDPETGGFMQVSNTTQPIRSSPLPYVGEGEIPLMSEDLSYKPAPPPNPMDSIIDELGWTPGRKKYFMAQYKADPKGAMKGLERSYLELDRASRKGRVEARDVLAKEKAIAEAMGVPLGKYLQQKADKQGVRVDVQNIMPGAKEAAKSLASPIGDRAEASLSLAEGAAETMNNANMVRQALDKGQVIAGPMAGARLKWAQLQNIAGFGNPEQVTQTRTAIQGLAALTLDSRASLKGQGQITEGESKLLERARSGNIEEMTVDELQTVVDVAQRLASRQWQRHDQLLTIMRDDPNAAASYRYYLPSTNLPPPVGRKGKAQPQQTQRPTNQPAQPGKPSVSNW